MSFMLMSAFQQGDELGQSMTDSTMAHTALHERVHCRGGRDEWSAQRQRFENKQSFTRRMEVWPLPPEAHSAQCIIQHLHEASR